MCSLFSVSERIRENEAVKLIRLKEGLLRMSGAYCELSHKANVVFTAQRVSLNGSKTVLGRIAVNLVHVIAMKHSLHISSRM